MCNYSKFSGATKVDTGISTDPPRAVSKTHDNKACQTVDVCQQS